MLIGLDGPRITILWWTLPTYMTLIGAAILVSGGLLIHETRRTWRTARAVDSALLALALGLVLARIEHVALNWPYFVEAPSEIFSLAAGGLGPHGAVAGACLGGLIAARLFRSDYTVWLGGAAFALPIIAFAAWWGCAASVCAYGAKVANLSDHPAWLVWEAQGDFLMLAPRYAVQPLGMAAAALVLLLVLVAAALGLRGRRRAGAALAGVMIVSFALGFLRDDPSGAVTGLSMNQWLDATLAGAGVLLTAWPRRTSARAA